MRISRLWITCISMMLSGTSIATESTKHSGWWPSCLRTADNATNYLPLQAMKTPERKVTTEEIDKELACVRVLKGHEHITLNALLGPENVPTDIFTDRSLEGIRSAVKIYQQKHYNRVDILISMLNTVLFPELIYEEPHHVLYPSLLSQNVNLTSLTINSADLSTVLGKLIKSFETRPLKRILSLLL